MNVLVAFLMAFISLGSTPLSKRQMLLPKESLEAVRSLEGAEFIAAEGSLALIQIPSDRVESLSEQLHQNRMGKGGFRDVTDDLFDGKYNIDKILQNDFQWLRTKFWSPSISRNPKAVHLVDSIDVQHLTVVLTDLAAFDDRAATSENGTRASQMLAEKAAQIGKGVPQFSVRTIATRSYPKQPSVVATLVGSNPNLPHVLIGAHMDTLPSHKPGADDDASGCAVVMEALRAIVQSGFRFERTIDFAWYAGEEMGLVGSASVVKEFQKNRVEVAAVMQFDMVAWVNPHGLHDLYLTDDFTDPGLTQTLEKIINTYFPEKTVGHARCGYSCSDHASWTFASVPAVYPFESHHDDDNPFIHTSDDVVSILSMEHASTFAKIAVAFVSHIGQVQ